MTGSKELALITELSSLYPPPGIKVGNLEELAWENNPVFGIKNQPSFSRLEIDIWIPDQSVLILSDHANLLPGLVLLEQSGVAKPRSPFMI